MSKLIDSLTGYFFAGDQAPAAASASAGRVPNPDGNALATPRFQTEMPTPSLRLRDRLLLRRPLHRSTPPAAKPWGDDEVASPRIHPSAIIDRRAELAADVAVGPYCVIGPHVTLGPGTRLHNSVTLAGHTTIGSDNEIFPYAVIGAAPQDKKYKGEPTRLVIGDSNVLREFVTIHPGTVPGGGVTRVGDRNLIMVNCHIGHDVQMGNDCIFANSVMLAGHCHVGNRVNIMGGGAMHHFVTAGDLVFIGAYSRLRHDAPPYFKVDGDDEIRGLNVIGLRRAGFPNEDITALERAARRLFYTKEKPMSVTIAEMVAEPDLNPRVREVIDSLRRRNLGTKGRYLESLRRA